MRPFGANSARFLTNAIDTRTNGVDATANYRADLGSAGSLRLSAGYTLPDRNVTLNSFNGIQTFPSHSPFGMNGRFLYGRVTLRL